MTEWLSRPRRSCRIDLERSCDLLCCWDINQALIKHNKEQIALLNPTLLSELSELAERQWSRALKLLKYIDLKDELWAWG